MVGKILEYNGNVGKIFCGTTEMTYPFVRESVTGIVEKGDMVDFKPNGLHGVDRAAINISKRGN